MKHIILILSILIAGCTTEAPTEFSEAALMDKVYTIDDKESNIKGILDKYKGKKVLIDVWASWCPDCIKGLPHVTELQENFKDVTYVFISVDKSKEDWKNGIKKYNVTGEHYLLPSDTDGPFGRYIDLDWIPRYMVINPEGKITMFKAVEANDKKVLDALKN